MAKQLRPQPRPTKNSTESSSARSGRKPGPETVQPAESAPAAPGPQRRSTYFEAVALYERGVESLQRHDYREASAILESVLRQYPEEKELHERVRLYLKIGRAHV